MPATTPANKIMRRVCRHMFGPNDRIAGTASSYSPQQHRPPFVGAGHARDHAREQDHAPYLPAYAWPGLPQSLARPSVRAGHARDHATAQSAIMPTPRSYDDRIAGTASSYSPQQHRTPPVRAGHTRDHATAHTAVI